MKAIVLLSGGIDSAVVAASLKAESSSDLSWAAIFFDYDQRNRRFEARAAKHIVDDLGAGDFITWQVNFGPLRAESLLLDSSVTHTQSNLIGGLAQAVVPGRNVVLTSLAAAYGSEVGAYHIFIGPTSEDQAGFPDCRPEAITAVERMCRTSIHPKIRIHAPLIEYTKQEVILLAEKLEVDLSKTWSCYTPTTRNAPCGQCGACRVREDGFRAADRPDPLNAQQYQYRFREVHP